MIRLEKEQENYAADRTPVQLEVSSGKIASARSWSAIPPTAETAKDFSRDFLERSFSERKEGRDENSC